MITISGLTKSYGKDLLFDNVSFQLGAKEKVGVVGRNGHGKTTLFRIICKDEDFESGNLIFPKNYRIGWVKQELRFSADNTLHEGALGLPESERDHFWKVEKILFGLGFSEEDLTKNPRNLSGGFQVRLNLAQTLLSEPDLLLLDEPNNFLDITSIRWLEKYLQNWPREILLITHDRSFMDSIVTHTMAIHRKKFRKIKGDTEKLYSQIAQDEEIYENTRQNDDKKKKEVELFISRFRAKARLAGLVQSRVKALSKMEKRDKLDKVKTLDFAFKSEPFAGKYLLNIKHLSYGYEKEHPLFTEFNLSVKYGDRIFIIGRNGKGKTTLLRTIAGEIEPQSGELSAHPAVQSGKYLESNLKFLENSRTVLEEIQQTVPGIENQHARDICGLVMFQGDDALKKISVLSGGEKSRVMFGKVLAKPANLLLLDEPTNHLDLESCDALLAALDYFPGAIIMVTHNEMLLNSLSERLVVFENDNATLFEGSYPEFLEKRGWQDEEIKNLKLPGGKNESEDSLNKKELRKIRSRIIAERSQNLKPLEKKIKAMEDSIAKLETLEQKINEELILASQEQRGEKINELSKQLHQNKKDIDELYHELDILTKQHEDKSKTFELELVKLSDKI